MFQNNEKVFTQPRAAANGLPAVRSRVAGIRERAVRSTRLAEAVAELGSLGHTQPNRASSTIVV